MMREQFAYQPTVFLSSRMRTAFFNNDFIDEDKVLLHASDLSIQRGYGVFDFFKVINGVPVFLTDHLERFFNSAYALGLEAGVTRRDIANIAQQLASRNNIAYSGIKITLTGGYSADGYNPGKPNLIITQQQMSPRPADMFEKGLNIITYEHVRELPEIKSINYITGVLLQKKLAATGADDVLYHKDGEISEFPRSNFFIVTKENKVITPAKNVLKGITRKKTLQLAHKQFTAEEGIVTLEDARNAKEAFITSTSKQITPIVRIEGTVIGNGQPGEVTRFLDKAFQQLLPTI